MPADKGVAMERKCVVCGDPLVKKPGPGRWPTRCASHRIRVSRSMTPEERSASAARAAQKRWETWRKPGMKAAASARAKSGAAARWAGHVSLARGCGHPVDKSQSGAMPRWCTDCLGAPVACRWDGCSVVVGAMGARGARKKWCAAHRLEKSRMESRDNFSRQCSDVDCVRPVRARGLCSMHWKRARAAEIGYKPQPFDGARMRRHYERRTWQKSGENVTVDGLRARDGDDCGICGDPIDFALSGREKWGRTVDHVIPRAKGGAHTWGNCQLAHSFCNLSKGATLDAA